MAHLMRSPSQPHVTVVWSRGSSSPGTATGLLRAEVARIVGTSVADVRLTRSCGRCGSTEHGRPGVRLAGEERPLFVSLSRGGGAVAVAVSECGPVGVDVERVDAASFPGFDGVALHDREVAPTVEARVTTWVRKEALLKACGKGLQVDPRLVRVSGHDEPARLAEWAAPDPPEQAVWMRDFVLEGHAACVAVLSNDPPRIMVREAAPEGTSC